jgi:hypothetical protein
VICYCWYSIEWRYEIMTARYYVENGLTFITWMGGA